MNSRFTIVLTVLVMTTLFLASCTPSTAATPTSTLMPPTAVPISITPLTLEQGDFYFSTDGSQGFIFARNMAGIEPRQYSTLLEMTSSGGSRLARIQLDSMGTGITPAGEIDEVWAGKWEQVLDDAAAEGINVILVFSGWFDWNDGNPDYGYSTWESNTFNAANGGPASTPAELFTAGSPTQAIWLDWLETLVTRWQDRENIAAWEIFSEVNLATGVTEASGTAFVEAAAALIRAADTGHRPTTASLADVGEWPTFFQSSAIDFIDIHPYPSSAQLDTYIIQETRRYLAAYGKPVLIGESGLNAATPDSDAGKITIAERAPIGINHAIWAAVVSGAMNGRTLYWEDSFAIFFPWLGFAFLQKYTQAESAAAIFVQGVDYDGFIPLDASPSANITGAALGNDHMIIGWFRDAACEPPEWNLQPVISGQTVTITIPGTAAEWQVDFYDTEDGTTIIGSDTVTNESGTITITLPDFQDDIVFKITAAT